MPLAVDSFRICKPGTDLYWSLLPPNAGCLPNNAPWPITLRPGTADALVLTFRDGMLLHRDSGRRVAFPRQFQRRNRCLVLSSLPPDRKTIDTNWASSIGDPSLAAESIWNLKICTSVDGTRLVESPAKHGWQIERLHSERFAIVKGAFESTGTFSRLDLDGLCRLDLELLLEQALSMAHMIVNGTNAAVEIVSALPQAELVARALIVLGEICDRDAAYRVLNLVVGNYDLKHARIVMMASLPVLAQFYCRNDCERIRGFTSRLLRNLDSESLMPIVLHNAIRDGNIDFYRLFVMETSVQLDDSVKIDLVTMASEAFVSANGFDDVSPATRERIVIETMVDCMTCSETMIDLAISGSSTVCCCVSHCLVGLQSKIIERDIAADLLSKLLFVSLLSDEVVGCRVNVERSLDLLPYAVSESQLRFAASVVTAIQRDGFSLLPLLVAHLLHRLYHLDRTNGSDALIENLVIALTPFLPPGHPGPLIYRPTASIQQLPLEITLHIFHFLPPSAMAPFCRSHKAAYRCIYDRQVAAAMLRHYVILPFGIGKCSAVTVDVLKLSGWESDECLGMALGSVILADRHDIIDYIMQNCPLDDETLKECFEAAACAKNGNVFADAVEKMTRELVIESVAECTEVDAFQFSPVMDILRSFNVRELESLIHKARSFQNDLPLTALTNIVGRDLSQEAVDCIYDCLLCEINATFNHVWDVTPDDHRHVEDLMANGRYPMGAALVRCAAYGVEFSQRYMRRWPLDHAAVFTALEHQLHNCSSNWAIMDAVELESDLAYLLSHSERPTWPGIIELLQTLDIDDYAVWSFAASVESHYDFLGAESLCLEKDYNVLVSTYFPQAASGAFLAKTVSSLLKDDSITEARLPAILQQNGEVAARLFETAVANENVLVVDYILTMPTMPDQLKNVAFEYTLSGKRQFFQRRILDFIDQRGLVDDYVEFWIGQFYASTDSFLSTAFPSLREQSEIAVLPSRVDYRTEPHFTLASERIAGFPGAFDQRLCETLSGEQLVIRTETLRPRKVHPSVLQSASCRIDVGTALLAEHNSGSYTFMTSMALSDSDCMILEFVKRESFPKCDFGVTFGDKIVYKLTLTAYGTNQDTYSSGRPFHFQRIRRRVTPSRLIRS